MTKHSQPFILADGSIDIRAALQAGRVARSRAFHDLVKPAGKRS